MTQHILILVAVLGAGATLVSAKVLCPDVTPMTGLEPAKYLNRWYELKRVTRPFEIGGQCSTATYTLAKDGYIVVYNRQYLPATGRYASLIGNATLAPDAGDEAKLLVRFPVTPVVANYWVLGTDYDHYSVVWSCNNETQPETGSPRITVWVLSREPTLSNEYWEIVNNLLRTNKVDLSILVDNDQTNCPAVTCSGCPVVQTDLDVTKVSGTWQEVKHLNNSIGASNLACTNAKLAASTNGISIAASARDTSSSKDVQTFNSASWETTSSKDGAFVLTGDNVNAGNKAEFCILATDYTGYAVVSECIEQGSGDLDTETPVAGGLWVWSRNGLLTPDQEFKVNEVLVTANYPRTDLLDTPRSQCSDNQDNGSAWMTASTLLIALCLCITL